MCTEDSPSGLWRTLGKRVGCKPSGVRIPHPPPPDPGTCPGSGVFFAFAAKSPHRRGGALLQRIRVFPLVVELEGKNRGTKYEISTTRRGGRWGAFLLVLRVAPPDLRPPRGLPRRAGLLGVPVGGGPPALRAFGSARRLEARPGPATAHWHRGRSLRRPSHRRRCVAGVCLCVGSKPGQAPCLEAFPILSFACNSLTPAVRHLVKSLEFQRLHFKA